MQTIIEKLKEGLKNQIEDYDFDEIDEVKKELEKAKERITELENEINDQDSYLDVETCDTYQTALGTIHVHNQTGNLMLHQEIDDFFKIIVEKYN